MALSRGDPGSRLGSGSVRDALNRRNDTQLALAALKTAIKCRAFPFGFLHHTDRGSPYASDEYQAPC